VEFVRRYPGLFDEEQVWTDLGRHVIVARRDGRTWFVAAMGGPAAVGTTLELGFLARGTRYRASIHHDVPGELRAAHATREVDATTILPLAMEPDGGQVMIIEPVE
jgi:alpha-glucosidase